ncbi:MAG: TatD family hydrolase, partial [Muribaculaceae bacterium]|nr:TatD family hydrolase [Muribaculaceae bacterium]
MVDTHTHLYLSDYGNDKCAAVDRALAAGVELMILPGVDSGSIQPIRQLHQLRPQATAMCAGLHPTEVKPQTYVDELTAIENELRAHPADYVAVGEIGLDLYWDQTTLRYQLQAAEAQINLAEAQNLPVIIHCRSAMAPMIDLLTALKGRLPHLVFHCYSGTNDDVAALRRLQPDVMFGIGGVLTFKNSPLPNIVPTIGLNNILLETDAPWLAPVPMRGKQNESSYLPHIANHLALILKTTP